MDTTKTRIVDHEITLVPYRPNEEVALKWYQDPDVCKQVDNIDFVYDLERLRNMYGYLSKYGDCYYIEYRGIPIGDITLKDNEISIVICKEYQNRHIGRRCVENILALAREKGLPAVKAQIYDFNKQSQRMFLSVGFQWAEGDRYVFTLSQHP